MRKKDLKKELERKQAIIDGLQNDNAQLRVRVSDTRKEAEEAINAKEVERWELCNQLGELQEKAKKDSATIAHQSDTIRRIIKENAFLIKTNANLSGKFVQNHWLKRIYGKWGKSEDKK